MANTNEYGSENCDMVKEVQQVKKEQEQEEPMPHMTTTDKLLRPGGGKE